MTLGDVIKKYRDEHGMSMADFSKVSGISKAYISMLEKNKTQRGEEPAPSIEMYRNVAEVIGVSVDELVRMVDGKVTISFSASGAITEPGPESPSPETLKVDNLFTIETKKFPLLGRVACGAPIFADGDRELYVEAGANIKADFCLRARGDSMIGARIQDGDIVFIHQQEMVEDGEIAAVLIEDEATLKRVQYNRSENELLLFAENPKYKTMRFTGEELNHIRILGKAVAFQSDVK